LDSWDNDLTDRIHIQFDSLPAIPGWAMDNNKPEAFHPVHTCGVAIYRDVPNIRVFGWIAHTASALNLKIISGLETGTDDESVGLKYFNFIFAHSPASPDYVCARTEYVALKGQHLCHCLEGQYSINSTSEGCTDCDQSCSSCFGPSASECYACKPGYYFDGNICTICHSSCVKCSGGGEHECLACQNGYVLNNGTCVQMSSLGPNYILDPCTESCISSCHPSNDSDSSNGSLPLMCQEGEIMDTECKGIF